MSLRKILLFVAMLLILVLGIILTRQCFELGSILGFFLLGLVLLSLVIFIFLFKSVTKLKLILSIVVILIGFTSFFVYFGSYSKTEEYRINKIESLYSKIYTKVNKKAGKGWVSYKYEDIYGNNDTGFYYDEDKISVSSNSTQMIKRIKELRKDIPLLTNISCSSTGKLTWDPVNIGFNVNYTIYVDDKELETITNCEYQLENINSSLLKVKILVSEKNERYFNSTENYYDAKFDIVTVTIFDMYGRNKEYILFKGDPFDINTHTSYTKLFNGKLYYDSQCTKIFDPSTNIHNDLTLYEGALDYYADPTVGLSEVNPNVSGTFVIPNTVKFINTNAFKGCDLITKIIINHDIDKIYGNAFNSLASLKEVIIKGKVNKIYQYAFHDCDNVVYYYLSSGIDTIENFAFQNNRTGNNDVIFLCEGRKGYSWGERWYQSKTNKSGYAYTSGIVHENIVLDNVWSDSEGLYSLNKTTKKATLLRYLSIDKTSYTVADSINVNGIKYIVTGIGYQAFAEHDELNSIYLGENVTYCGETAFYSISSTVYFAVSSDKGFHVYWDEWSNITPVWNYKN